MARLICGSAAADGTGHGGRIGSGCDATGGGDAGIAG